MMTMTMMMIDDHDGDVGDDDIDDDDNNDDYKDCDDVTDDT